MSIAVKLAGAVVVRDVDEEVDEVGVVVPVSVAETSEGADSGKREDVAAASSAEVCEGDAADGGEKTVTLPLVSAPEPGVNVYGRRQSTTNGTAAAHRIWPENVLSTMKSGAHGYLISRIGMKTAFHCILDNSAWWPVLKNANWPSRARIVGPTAEA